MTENLPPVRIRAQERAKGQNDDAAFSTAELTRAVYLAWRGL
jgi:hypothetical protein